MAESPGAPRRDALLGGLALAAALPLPWPPAVMAALLAVSLAWTPGALLAPVLWPRAGAAGRALFALATAPLLAGGAMVALLAAGMAAPAAARAVLVAIAVAAWLSLLRNRPAAIPGARGDGAVPWLAAGAWTAGIAALHLVNPGLAPRSDGWFHAAVTLQLADLPLPPEDPYFAGLRLLYFWGYHAWAAQWLALVPGIDVWTPLLCLNLAGAVAVVLGVCLLARRLGAGPGGQWVAAAVATFGYAPFAWVWIGVRMAGGEVQGLDEFRRVMSFGVDPPLHAMATGMLHASMVFFGDKFLVLTPFALGLAQFTLIVLTLLDFIARPGGREGLALGAAVTAALFIHSVVGWSAALIAGGWWWWALWRARRPGEGALRPVLLRLPLVFLAAAALLLPYLATTTVGKEQTLAPGFSVRAFATWVLSGMLIVPAGMLGLRAARRRVAGAADLLVFAVLLSAAGCSIWLPGENQSKFFNLLLLLLAAPAGIALADLHGRAGPAGRAGLVAVLLLATLPTVGFAVYGFATERAQLGEAWQRPGPGEIAAMHWARDRTPRRAAFVDSTLALDLPVLARRTMMSGGPRWEQNWRYPSRALRLRREAVAELGSLRPCSDSVRVFLEGLDRPIYVARRRSPGSESAAEWRSRLARETPGYTLVYSNPAIAFYRWGGEP